MSAARELEAVLDSLELFDHHTHGAFAGAVERDTFELTITESSETLPDGKQFESQLGFAILGRCAPVLGLEAHASADDYLARRAELGAEEVTRRLLGAAGIGRYLIDTGFRSDEILDPPAMTGMAGAPCDEVVRLESVAEDLARGGVSADGFADAFARELGRRLDAGAVGTKSIVAYRYGLDFEPERPDPARVVDRASRWLGGLEGGAEPRLDDPTLMAFLMWCAVDARVPLQLHVGYGDLDLELIRCNPLHMTEFLRRTRSIGTPITLLHCYPYHREAGYLAQVFPHVYFDVGLALHFIGAQSVQLVAESLELVPFHKQLFSTDAWGLPELHYLAARLWRKAMATVLGAWVEAGEWSRAQAERVCSLIGVENGARVYRLPPP